MIKKISVVLASTVLLAGCFPFLQQPTEESPEVDEAMNEQEQEIAYTPQIPTAENFYQSVLYDGTYMHGQSRGFGNEVVNNRLDLNQLELGLTSIAQDYFDPDTYFFREGQFIQRSELNSWLSRNSENNPLGLNPALGEGSDMRQREENRPRSLSHILEHNYLVEDSEGVLELGGIVIGLSMNSVYNFRVEDNEGLYYFYETALSEEYIREEGERIAQEVVNRLRAENREEGAFNDVPIVIAMFQEQPRESVIPGHFFRVASADPGSNLSGWQDINERHYLFPSNTASQDVRNDAEDFLRFRDEVQGFFESYIGVVGRGYYRDNQLQELTVEIPIRYQGKAEIVALSQFIADKMNRFSDNIKIQVYIHSVGGQQEGLIVRNPNTDPFIHIFD